MRNQAGGATDEGEQHANPRRFVKNKNNFLLIMRNNANAKRLNAKKIVKLSQRSSCAHASITRPNVLEQECSMVIPRTMRRITEPQIHRYHDRKRS
jgi:hypothetical protein